MESSSSWSCPAVATLNPSSRLSCSSLIKILSPTFQSTFFRAQKACTSSRYRSLCATSMRSREGNRIQLLSARSSHSQTHCFICSLVRLGVWPLIGTSESESVSSVRSVMKTQTVVVLVTLLVACVRIQTGRNNFIIGRDVAITIWGK